MTFVKYFAKRAIFCDFRIDSAFYIAEHENAAVLDVYVDFAAEGYIGQSSRIAGFEQEFVKRIFEILRVAHKRAFAVGDNGYSFALLRGEVKFALDIVYIESVLFRLCVHTDSCGKAHNGQVAKHVVHSSSCYAVKYD